MARKRFWTSDALWAAGIALLVLAAGASPLLRGLERWAYDVGVRASTREPAPNISIVAIDEHSIRSLGRWPWRREVHAKMFDTLAGAGAKVVASTVLFSEPQEDAGTAPCARSPRRSKARGLRRSPRPARSPPSSRSSPRTPRRSRPALRRPASGRRWPSFARFSNGPG
ncbi:MAG: CHASE2 domain-containing protein [Burkholderiales bacterium]|nr:CHASE2 domain-containing protein [Burkholderiales bacterium]